MKQASEDERSRMHDLKVHYGKLKRAMHDLRCRYQEETDGVVTAAYIDKGSDEVASTETSLPREAMGWRMKNRCVRVGGEGLCVSVARKYWRWGAA